MKGIVSHPVHRTMSPHKIAGKSIRPFSRDVVIASFLSSSVLACNVKTKLGFLYRIYCLPRGYNSPNAQLGDNQSQNVRNIKYQLYQILQTNVMSLYPFFTLFFVKSKYSIYRDFTPHFFGVPNRYRNDKRRQKSGIVSECQKTMLPHNSFDFFFFFVRLQNLFFNFVKNTWKSAPNIEISL